MSGYLGQSRKHYEIRLRNNIRYSPDPPGKFNILAYWSFVEKRII